MSYLDRVPLGGREQIIHRLGNKQGNGSIFWKLKFQFLFFLKMQDKGKRIRHFSLG